MLEHGTGLLAVNTEFCGKDRMEGGVCLGGGGAFSSALHLSISFCLHTCIKSTRGTKARPPDLTPRENLTPLALESCIYAC